MFEMYLNQLKDMDLFSNKTAAKVITKNSRKTGSIISIREKFSFCKYCSIQESVRTSRAQALRRVQLRNTRQ